MLIYFIILLIAMAPTLLNVSRPKPTMPGFAAFFFVLLVFVGLRFHVGPDWDAYEGIYGMYSDYAAAELHEFSEPGFFLLNKACGSLGFGFQGVIFFCALMFLYGCFAFARTTFDPWMAIASVLPYLVYIIAASGIRQAAAIGIGFLIVARGTSMATVRRLLLVAVAMSFHNSAVILLLLVLLPLKVSALVRAVLIGGTAVVVAYNVGETEAVGKYSKVYLESNVVSDGAFFHVLLIAFPAAVYLYNRKKMLVSVTEDPNVRAASYMAIGAIPLLAVSSTGFDRLSLYLSFVQMWVYPALVQAKIGSRGMLITMISGITLATFFVYFRFGSHAFAYVPYRSILFID